MSATDIGLSARVEDFDSAFLNGAVWRLNVPSDVTQDALHNLVGRAEQAGVRLMFCRLPEGSLVVEPLLMVGFRQVETLITYEAVVPPTPAAFPRSVELARASDLEDCAMIARGSFTWDRYHQDADIPRSVGDRIKEQWVRNAFAGRADHILVIRTATGRVGGFLLLLRQQSVGIVDLVAVTPECRGQGLGKALLLGALATLADTPAEVLRAGTQEANGSSAAMYLGSGFRPVAKQFTFHWIPGGGRTTTAPPASAGSHEKRPPHT